MVTCPGEAGTIVSIGKPAKTETLSKNSDWFPLPEEVPTIVSNVDDEAATKLKSKLFHCIPVPEDVNVKDLLELPAVTETDFDPFPPRSFWLTPIETETV
jgi:hypothetical protein